MQNGQIFKALQNTVGGTFTIKKTLISSAITTAALDLTGAATGEVQIIEMVAKTDATGLAGGTNFEILCNNAKGQVNIFVETVANLGANITKVMSGGAIQAETTTGDAHPTVTACPTVIEAGKKVQYKMTSSVGTGAGTIDIYITFRRLANGAGIKVA